jgi:hypothetical protein
MPKSLTVRNNSRAISRMVLGGAMVVAAISSACDRNRVPTEAHSLLPNQSKSQEPVRGSKLERPAEGRFVEIANEVPGFAGYLLDGRNRLLIA